jgi:Ca2+:H+ antiporter
VTRRILFGLLALAPITIVADRLHLGETALFILAASALIPLAWLIGEATDHAAEHTGPGVGGFLNASFGNAPEIIIALLAVSSAQPDVVRGSLAGSVVSNLLLVLGLSLFVATRDDMDRGSLLAQVGIVLFAAALFLVPSIPSWDGDPERDSLFTLTIPVGIALLVAYLIVTVVGLRRHRRLHLASGHVATEGAWTFKRSLTVLAVATVVTAFISEILVHSLEAFADAVGASSFFVAIVVVAIVGNAAEHGGAVVLAKRGRTRLATEIAISSSAQVALFVAPLVAVLSFLVGDPLPLSFRPVEIATMVGAALLVGAIVLRGRATRLYGMVLLATYLAMVVLYLYAGDR